MTPVVQLLVLLATPGVPLVLALLLLVNRGCAALHRLSAVAALPAFMTSLLMPPGIAATVPWLLEGSEFGLDAAGRIFLFFSAAIWLAAGLHALESIREAERGRFLVHFLLVMSGNLGLLVARDMLAFYLFFSLMSFATYGLVAHDGRASSRRAARVYMVLVVAADLMLYAALIPAAFASEGELLLTAVRQSILDSPHRQLVIALVLIGFGVKAGLLGVHVALPLIYGAAPMPAGAVLAGAMIHAGLLGWLRFLPLGAALPGWGAALILAGIAAAFYGVLVGVTQRQAPVVLAYSSISQMGLMTAGIGVALLAPEHSAGIVTAVIVFAMHHAFAKASLFLALGLPRGTTAGVSHRTLVKVGLLLPCAALAGAPLTSGMLAKEYLKETVTAAPGFWGPVVSNAITWSAVATTLIVARLLWLAWPRRLGREAHGAGREADGASLTDPRGPLRLLAWFAIFVLSTAAVFALALRNPPDLWHARVWWGLLWPIGVGAAAAWAVARRRIDVPAAPPGDVVVVALRLGRTLMAGWRWAALGALASARDALRSETAAWLRRPLWSRSLARAEEALIGWGPAIALYVMLLLTFVLVTIGA